MIIKKFFLSWLAAAVGTFVFNGLFHGLLAADFFDRNNAALGSAALKMADFKPLPIVLLELILAFSLTWILFRVGANGPTLKEALSIGALFHFSTAMTWNLANMASFVSWPLAVVAGDSLWHVLMGLLAGWLIYKTGFQRSKI